MFDFTNYTFSGLIAIFAALIGMGYPLILQCVQRVDEQYHSIYLTDYVRNLKSLRLFRILLVVNVALSISCPFLIYHLQSAPFALIIVATQSVFVLALLISLIYLASVMMKVYSAPEFFELLESDDKVREMFEVVQYTAYPETAEFFRKNYAKVLIRFNEQLNESNVLSPEYEGIVERLIFCASERESSKRNLLFYDNEISRVLMSSLAKRFATPVTYRYMRSFLNRVVDTGNKVWFTQFVDAAYSYKNIRIDLYQDYSSYEWTDADAQFRHFMTWLGGLLVYKKQYEWLKEFMFYATELPPKYSIQLNTLSEVIDEIKWIESVIDRPLLLATWGMYGMSSAINMDYEVYSEMHKYLSWEYMRLYFVRNHIVETHLIGDYDVSKLQYLECKSLLLSLRKVQDELSYIDFDRISFVFGGDVDVDYKKPLEKIIKSLEERIIKIETIPSLSTEKLDRFRGELIDTVRLDDLALPITEDEISGMIEPETARFFHNGILLEKKYLAKELPDWLYGVAEGIVKQVNRDIRNYYYSRNFMLIAPIQAESVYYYDIKSWIDGLKLTNSYMVLFSMCEEIKSENYMSQRINGMERSVIVLRFQDLPKILLKDTAKEGWSRIDEESKLYSNINHMEERDGGFGIGAARVVRFFRPKNLKYIKADIVFDKPESTVFKITNTDLKLLD